MPFLLLPTLGPLHLAHPRYNAVTLVELTRAFEPDAVLLASVSPEGLASGAWRDREELGLFFLLPWAERSGVPVEAIGDRAEDLAGEAERFRDYLGEMAAGRVHLEREAGWREPLEAALKTPLTPERAGSESFLEAIEVYLNAVRTHFGEGPATGFRELRMTGVAETVRRRGPGRYVIWVDLLDYPELHRRLPEARLPGPHEPTEAERQRAVLDRAWQLAEEDDPEKLLSELQAIGGPEAGYLAAQLYLAAGRPADALALLEQVAEGDFQHPDYLPGYLLARLGQLRDLVGERERAIRAYRGVLALSWAPEEARTIALAGLRTPFRLA